MGEVTALHCTYNPTTRSGNEVPTDKKRVQATIHWVSAQHALDAEVRLYDRLFLSERPGGEDGQDFIADLNPASLEVMTECQVEPSLASAAAETHFQFE